MDDPAASSRSRSHLHIPLRCFMEYDCIITSSDGTFFSMFILRALLGIGEAAFLLQTG